MKQYVFLSYVIATVILGGCKKTVKDTEKNEFVEGPLCLVVKNAQGQNLLNPATIGHFSEDDIKVFYLMNGEDKLYYDPDLNWSKGFNIAEGGLFLRLVYYRAKGILPVTTTYIQWNDQDKDTIVCYFEKKDDGKYKHLVSVYYNGAYILPEGYTHGAVNYNGALLNIVK